LQTAPDCLADNNCFLSGAMASIWGDKQSKVANNNSSFKLVNSASGVMLTIVEKSVPTLSIPMFDPTFIGFFALSKQYCEAPNGTPITVDTDFTGASAAKNQPRLAGPFYQYPSMNGKGISLFNF
jgi:alpha-N-arabinofuranosidase